MKAASTISRLTIAVIIIALSSSAFLAWWLWWRKPKPVEVAESPALPSFPFPSIRETPPEKPASEPAPPPQEDPELAAKKAAAIAAIKSRISSLILADSDLMEIDTGKVLAKNWLDGAKPMKLWFDGQSEKFIAQYEHGFRRLNLDGSVEKELGKRFGVLVTEDLSLALFAEKENIWTAGINWRDFEFEKPTQVTTTGGFKEGFVLENIMMASKGAVIISNMNQLVRVNLRTGEVSPTKVPVTQAPERRSPDRRFLLGQAGDMKGQTAYIYDVETDSVKSLSLGTSHLIASAWQGSKRCY